jgi:hypothetical protein
MPSGFVVRVMTKPMSGGHPLRVLYAVALENEEVALNAVLSKTGPDEVVEVVGQLAAGTVHALQLAPGQISML